MRTAREDGSIEKGGRVIEATSGNMGISLSMLSGIFDYRPIIFMPENMSEGRAELIKKYGAELILTPAFEGMEGAISRAEKMARETKNGYTPGQFYNKRGVFAHFFGTGSELFADMGGRIDSLVCGVGTAATLSGAGRYLKRRLRHLRLVAVEPSESALLSGGRSGRHIIEGIGAGFVPPLYDADLVDRVISLPGDSAVEMKRLLSRLEGIDVGISSGAALGAAIMLAREDDREQNIAIIFPDSGDRYST
jgi:cysteine synthase A